MSIYDLPVKAALSRQRRRGVGRHRGPRGAEFRGLARPLQARSGWIN